MQSTIGLGLIEILLFLFGNGGLLGMPPGERDVAFLKAAPQQSLVYLEWAARGAGKPNAAGIDGFIADPEIQSVLKAIDAGLAPVDLADGEEDVGQHRSRDALRLAKLITAHAGCLFVTIDPPPAGNGLLQVPTPQEFLARVHIGAILSGGADCAAIVDAVNRTAKLEIPARPQMHPIPGPMGLEVLIHQDGERLLIGFGEQAIPRIQKTPETCIFFFSCHNFFSEKYKFSFY